MVKRLMFNFTLRITTENTRATIPSAPNVVPIVGPVIAVCVVALLLVVVVVIMIRRRRQRGKMYLMIVSAILPFSHKKNKNNKSNKKDYKKGHIHLIKRIEILFSFFVFI